MILKKIFKKFNLRIKSEKGDGISIVIFGTIVMLALVFTSVNILNAKIVEEKYNTLRDSVQGAAAGSVIHLLLNETGSTAAQGKIVSGAESSTGAKYDIYLQLALGYLVNNNTTGNDDSINVQSGTVNNFIKLDHKKVIESTLELLSKTVLNVPKDAIIGKDNYDIVMFFIEPGYKASDSYKQSFDLIVYRTIDNTLNGTIVPVPQKETLPELYLSLQDTIDAVVGPTKSGKAFKINLGAVDDGSELIRDMQTRPYYLIVVKDFALPTLFEGGTREGVNFRDAFRDAVTFNDGRIQTPMCALQAGKVERKISN